MPSGYDQYSGIAGSIADQYGLDRSIFFGLIDSESSWNPNAVPIDPATGKPASSAYGFTQLLSGTAKDLGVNARDPVQNLTGGAKYLSQLLKQYGGNYTMALAAYHDGTNKIGQNGGYGYAATVLADAKKYASANKDNSFSSIWASIQNSVANGDQLSIPGNVLGGLTSNVGGVLNGVGDALGNGANAVGDAINNVAGFDLGNWLSGQATEAAKTYLLPIVLGFGALMLILFSAWGLVKDTPAGSAVKTGGKTLAGLAFV